MDKPKRITTDPAISADDPSHREIGEDGMQKAYVVLSPEECAKGFIRPIRRTYLHVGARPQFVTRELTADEAVRYSPYGYVLYEEYSADPNSSVVGRYWTKDQLQSGCGAATTMGQAIAETYARDPSFYGSTFCVRCRAHYPVGESGEFVWEDGTKVGT